MEVDCSRYTICFRLPVQSTIACAFARSDKKGLRSDLRRSWSSSMSKSVTDASVSRISPARSLADSMKAAHSSPRSNRKKSTSGELSSNLDLCRIFCRAAWAMQHKAVSRCSVTKVPECAEVVLEWVSKQSPVSRSAISVFARLTSCPHIRQFRQRSFCRLPNRTIPHGAVWQSPAAPVHCGAVLPDRIVRSW